MVRLPPRIGPAEFSDLRRATDPLFRHVGLSLDEEGTA
jgi:hypothetical protein